VQVAGYAVEFKAGLTFATVKGGGHMVPQTHPQAALALLKQWMQGRL
jgi:serine carboxypeptidase-like clade 1